MNVEQMIQRRTPRVLQYGVLQLMLFVMGIILALGVVQETGAIVWLSRQCSQYVDYVWVFGILSGAISTVLDTFATSMSFFSLYPSLPENDMFYKMVAYSSSMGGNVLLLGSVSGLALMKMENIHMGWYLKNVGWVVILSWILGILALCLLG